METKVSILWKLFFVFLKLSPFTFGGGYAMISLIEREIVTKHKWIEKKEIVKVLTVAQTIPGAIAINSAIFIGYRVLGTIGSIFALIGILLPTLVIMLAVSFTYEFIIVNPIIEAAFKGIGAAVIALIIHAGFIVSRTSIIDVATVIIAILSLGLLLLNVNPFLVIIIGFLMGIIINNVKLYIKVRRRNN